MEDEGWVWVIVVFVVLYLLSKCKENSNRKSQRRRIHPYQLLDNSLTSFASQLKPSLEFQTAASQAASEIYKFLKQDPFATIDLARFAIAGSCGKGTGITFFEQKNGSVSKRKPDIDLIIFVDNMNPPFEDLIKSWGNVLMSHGQIRNVQTWRFSLQFIYVHPTEGILKFDLLPARNYLSELNLPNYYLENHDRTVKSLLASAARKYLAEKQETHRKCKNKLDPDLNRMYSSCFSENTVEFIKEQLGQDDLRMLNVIRLAKYWCKKLEIAEYVPGKSCMIELIAIYAQQGNNAGYLNLLGRFELFLKAMAEFQTLIVCFIGREELPYSLPYNEANPMDGRVAGEEVTGRIRSLLTSAKIASYPVIVDPSNPYNNLTYAIQEKTVQLFEYQARRTLQLLKKYADDDYFESVPNPIEEIFRQKGTIERWKKSITKMSGNVGKLFRKDGQQELVEIV